MTLPHLEQPQRYRGLYVFDFGEWTAVGYTAEEIAALLEREEFAGGKTYKIVRVDPVGRLELRGVPTQRFHLESGMFFYRAELTAARDDFLSLRRLAGEQPPPCRAFLHLAEWAVSDGPRYATALVYPAEYEDEMARWLLKQDYRGGDIVEGGPSHVTDYYALQPKIMNREQLWSRPAIPARPYEELRRTVREPVQR